MSSDPSCKGGPFLIHSTAAQIVNIHHIKYEHNNHQQILTYKRVRYCLLTAYFFYYTKYKNDKIQHYILRITTVSYL